MGSIFTTPSDHLWVTNGQAEAILDGLIALASRRRDDRILLEFFRNTRSIGGLGSYGFDVTAPPFDDPLRRIALAGFVAELANTAATGEPADLVEVPWHELDPWIRCMWVSSLERLHDGIRVSVANALEPFRVPLDETWRALVEAHGILERIAELRVGRSAGTPEADVELELQLNRRVAEMLAPLPPGLVPTRDLELIRQDLGALQALQAQER